MYPFNPLELLHIQNYLRLSMSIIISIWSAQIRSLWSLLLHIKWRNWFIVIIIIIIILIIMMMIMMIIEMMIAIRIAMMMMIGHVYDIEYDASLLRVSSSSSWSIIYKQLYEQNEKKLQMMVMSGELTSCHKHSLVVETRLNASYELKRMVRVMMLWLCVATSFVIYIVSTPASSPALSL